ncbi:unnamed protein product [Sphagnum jensenii]|uniref:AAA ATPase AAA+ lid domain-containing protein n=1 Tax=Sphagnum jensenii TaxID=128206 RepID=A0ABP1ARC2_9BRYO
MWCCTHMQIHTSRMTLSDDVNLEEFVMTKDEFSGADIKAICTEAGLLALRERRMKVTQPDFKKAKKKVMYKKKEGVPEGLQSGQAEYMSIFVHDHQWRNYRRQLDSLVNAMLSWTQTQRVVLWKAILPLG